MKLQGYERSEEVLLELMDALKLALLKHPEQRLGQLLINLAPGDGYGQSDLWNIYDETWIHLLTDAAR